ncbi:beta-ketoacyl-ACP synthase III [Amycolatopsis sp. H20-H5]|uniref:beta-ketoacyl-ACP synthase III n=1 Tax=Amycolatopsis sp. H20-H5 TaxID=3046309 RepID=UPI002DB85F50|nr:beta-ketoacyl-ACP synthase III [Amycolatopsis sp. H20-H5]MEC3977522.1 beta-ketoacyl-ACP synthase III [Amycolatopsis sp. H20-H5]
MVQPGLRDRSAVIAGIGSWLPNHVVTNEDLAAQLDTSDEWIRSRTGIGTRHVIDEGMATSDLAVEAGSRALKSAGCPDVDGVLVATTTPDRPCPATAPDVASRLGLGSVPAFDIAAVCSGFVYGLAVASGLIALGALERVLVIGADAYSTILDPRDRTTRAVFGDGAGAVVLRAGHADEDGALGPFDLGSDGALADLITIPAGGSRQRSSPDRPVEREDVYFQMQGKKVFKNAVARMSESAREVLGRSGWTVEDVDHVVAHQANQRILNAVAAELGVPGERVVSNIERVGNTSAASIPLALVDAARSGALRPGDRVLLTAFGGGLTWGSTTLRWPDVVPLGR